MTSAPPNPKVLTLGEELQRDSKLGMKFYEEPYRSGRKLFRGCGLLNRRRPQGG